MIDSQNQFSRLFRKWMEGKASEEEEQQFRAEWKNMQGTPELFDLLKEDWLTVKDFEEPDEKLKKVIMEKIGVEDRYNTPVHRVRFLKTAWFRYAAILLVVLGLGAYFWTSSRKSDPGLADNKKAFKTDVAPGREGAILTLADGTQMVLDSLGNGVIAAQNGSQVVLQDGLLLYDKTGPVSAAVAYNTITTPKGRQFQLLLPDGSKVWLNAASSIRFPTLFDSKERKVEMTGEAYFEVAKHATAPFKILPGRGAEIVVLGTSLNVNAFENESYIATTLISGKIKVSSGKESVPLMPGQQATIENNISVEENADLAKVMAWKNGAFDFNGTSLRDAMRQLERWYDIEVFYENGVPDNIPFSGRISMKSSLKNLLKRLEGTSLKFRMEEGRKLIIEK